MKVMPRNPQCFGAGELPNKEQIGREHLSSNRVIMPGSKEFEIVAECVQQAKERLPTASPAADVVTEIIPKAPPRFAWIRRLLRFLG